MKKSMAQNVDTTWTFSGHLAGKRKKTRQFPEPRPVSDAYAMFVGFLAGLRGERLLDSAFAALVAAKRSQLQVSLSLACAKRLLSLKQAGSIVDSYAFYVREYLSECWELFDNKKGFGHSENFKYLWLDFILFILYIHVH